MEDSVGLLDFEALKLKEMWILPDKPSKSHSFPLFSRINPGMDVVFCSVCLLLEMNSADGKSFAGGQKSFL